MTSRPKMVLPPTVPLTINRDQNAGIPYRAESLGLSNDDLMGMISHTPPVFTPGSLELPLTKRSRSGSISGRLRSASDLEERGVIDRYQKGVLKVSCPISTCWNTKAAAFDMIILGFDHQRKRRIKRCIGKF